MSQTFYGITDRTLEYPWSRNGWGQIGSCPDLYQTKEAAQRQIDKGKISVMMQYGQYDPVVVEYELTLKNYLGLEPEPITIQV
jgi:hypothetical protein